MKKINAKVDKATAVGVLQVFVGGALVIISVIIALVGMAWTFIFDGTASTVGIVTLICTILGITLIMRGVMNYKLASRFRKIRKIMSESDSIKLPTLERELGMSRTKLVNTLQRQISRGYWLDTYLDEENGILVQGYNPTHLKSESDNQVVNELISKANGYIHKMMTINRSITDEELTIQVDTLVSISKQVYSYVDKNPEKANQVRQLSNYFLPTSVELLTTYLELQEQDVKSENMTNSMNEIKDMMNTVEAAFRKQLDALYGDKVMDASVEIEVMKGIMKNV